MFWWLIIRQLNIILFVVKFLIHKTIQTKGIMSTHKMNGTIFAVGKRPYQKNLYDDDLVVLNNTNVRNTGSGILHQEKTCLIIFFPIDRPISD